VKRFFLVLFLSFFITLSSYADGMPNLKYKNIKKKDKISYNFQTNTWSNKIDTKKGNYYIKTKGFGNFFDYVDSNRDFAFSTNCEYEFIKDGRFIGYSNRDLKFYEMSYHNNRLTKRALTKMEVQDLFPEHKIVSLSDFSDKTNSLKVKKHLRDLEIILYNETDKTFDNFTFDSGNAKFELYDLRGFITVTKPGMIQFAASRENDHKTWYILLIR